MLPISRTLSGLIALIVAFHHGAASGQSGSVVAEESVKKALEGIPAELLPYVVIDRGAGGVPIRLQDALGTAIRLATEVDGDDDLRDSLLQDAGMIALARGNPATAESVASLIRGHRAALLLLSVADHLLIDSKPDVGKARELANKAGSMLSSLKPWQAQRVLARLLVTSQHVGVPQATLALWWDQLNDKEARAEVAVRLLARQAESKGVFDRSQFQQEKGKLDPGQPVPGYLDAVEDLFRQAEQKVIAKQEPDSLLQSGFEVLSASHTLHAELLVRWASRFYLAGRQDLARMLFEMAEKNLGAPHEEIARLYYQIAQLWKLRDRAPVLQPRLERVEKEVLGFEQVYLPFACSWLSMAWDAAGDAQRAKASMLRAIEAASTNANPRMRVAGAAQICLCHATLGSGLSTEVAMLAAEILGTTVDLPKPSAQPSRD